MTIDNNKVGTLQYINTVILTVVGIFAMLIFISINNVRSDQQTMALSQIEFGKELLRLKTVQDINVGSVKDLDKRVTTLELNYLDYIKTWVDQNYIRKPQRGTGAATFPSN
jgi:hypothetical protein